MVFTLRRVPADSFFGYCWSSPPWRETLLWGKAGGFRLSGNDFSWPRLCEPHKQTRRFSLVWRKPNNERGYSTRLWQRVSEGFNWMGTVLKPIIKKCAFSAGVKQHSWLWLVCKGQPFNEMFKGFFRFIAITELTRLVKIFKMVKVFKYWREYTRTTLSV